jgi:hypothetical protein
MFNPIMNEVERDIIKELRIGMRRVITYNQAYVDRRVFNKVLRIKFFNWASQFEADHVYRHCEYMVNVLRENYGAYFLKPVMDKRFSHRYGRDYEIPCIIFIFNI